MSYQTDILIVYTNYLMLDHETINILLYFWLDTCKRGQIYYGTLTMKLPHYLRNASRIQQIVGIITHIRIARSNSTLTEIKNSKNENMIDSRFWQILYLKWDSHTNSLPVDLASSFFPFQLFLVGLCLNQHIFYSLLLKFDPLKIIKLKKLLLSVIIYFINSYPRLFIIIIFFSSILQ